MQPVLWCILMIVAFVNPVTAYLATPRLGFDFAIDSALSTLLILVNKSLAFFFVGVYLNSTFEKEDEIVSNKHRILGALEFLQLSTALLSLKKTFLCLPMNKYRYDIEICCKAHNSFSGIDLFSITSGSFLEKQVTNSNFPSGDF